MAEPILGDLQACSWTAHLEDARWDALLSGDLSVCVTIRKPFHSVTVVLYPSEPGADRFMPAGTRVRRIPLYFVDA